MEWADSGIVLAARRHGEGSAVVSLLTAEHGRHAGLARGAFSHRNRGLYEVGNGVAARWKARLADHLGLYVCELVHARAARVLDDPHRLAALSSVCALGEAALPERLPYPRIHDGLVAFLDRLESGEPWAADLVRWELALLAELGYGLDLATCAATGRTDELTHVSPRTGRALSREAGAPYVERLLALPAFLARDDAAAADRAEIAAGLRLTGWFLERHVFAAQGGRMPAARERFIERFLR